MKEHFTLTQTFPATPPEIYSAWLNSEKHSEMTGGTAECSDKIGAAFSAWDDYITGTNLSLTPNQEIVQSWRTAEFDDTDDDSKLTIALQAVAEGCELTLVHENIPAGQTQYKQGWMDHYFSPMHEYFGNG